jgi:tRNA modification GTPase
VAIAGKPNVGKSTLFNRLLGYDRVIVHETPGTTRDYVEEGLEMGGIFVNLVDTAGLMPGASGLDQVASRRASEVINQADLLVLVFDSSKPLDEQDFHLLETTRERPKILTINKIDLNIMLKESELLSDSVKISAKTGDNLDLLKKNISDLLRPKVNDSDIYLTRRRHVTALQNVKKCLLNIQQDVEQKVETIAFELHEALDLLGELTGKVMRKEILDRIFEEFCIGK